ncbi:predicted protein [Botrytis cinerea T4]|uniref:Uncharacterized protein n=1 Tax=Botryotinia fuckeliana (strain T4) TaxID=999810 RepID=G2YV80_BOTF4|nr:predicted protein [Botrytis cinerea T4]
MSISPRSSINYPEEIDDSNFPQQAWIQSQAVFRSYPRKENFVSDRVHAANTM